MFKQAKFSGMFHGKKLEQMLEVAKKYEGRIDVHTPNAETSWGLANVLNHPIRAPHHTLESLVSSKPKKAKKFSIPSLPLIDRLHPAECTLQSARTSWERVAKGTEYDPQQAATARDALQAHDRIGHIRQQVEQRVAEATKQRLEEEKCRQQPFRYGDQVQVSLMRNNRRTGTQASIDSCTCHC